MNGLVNRAIQNFLRDGWGAAAWADAARAAGVPAAGFEPMLEYDPALTGRLVAAAAARLDRDGDCLLEDLGTWLVSHPSRAGVRRLLRFGGPDFVEFLHSLDDLPARARLALPDLALPPLRLEVVGAGLFHLYVGPGLAGAGAVARGLLRAMADDYGALAVIEGEDGAGDGAAVLTIRLLDTAFAEGRAFTLGRA
ncbi:MAG: hypothetical protein RL216_3456 [Pseudomonadota bacterium]